MARRLRIQYPGARYHVFNRGNYRNAVFETTGARYAFATTLEETCVRFAWKIHAYVIMKNHYHLAVETPGANLADGMHWLQGTFAIRFNRFRKENGCLFQGRYHALLVEDDPALLRVVNYINLNPVRAGIVPPEAAGNFQWGSLHRLANGSCPAWLVGDVTLSTHATGANRAGWSAYLDYLRLLANDEEAQRQQGFDRISCGWAIGTDAWRKAVADEHRIRDLYPGRDKIDLDALDESRWRTELIQILSESGIDGRQIAEGSTPHPDKINVAFELRRRASAPYQWIAHALGLPSHRSLRMQLHRHRLRVAP